MSKANKLLGRRRDSIPPPSHHARLSRLATLALTACLIGATAEPLLGTWGGDRVQLMATAAGATIKFDCASGDIAGPLTLQHNGRFRWRGDFVQYRGGPQRADAPAGSTPALYTGKLHGDTLSLEITAADRTSLWQGDLHRGARMKFVRCL